MKLINEQLVYDIKGESIKKPFLYIRKCYLNDFNYALLRRYPEYQKQINNFFQQYFPGIISKKFPRVYKKFTLNKNDIIPSLTLNCDYSIIFTKLNENTGGVFVKPNIIKLNNIRFNYFVSAFHNYINIGKDFKILYKRILNTIKELFNTLKHEIIHLIDYQDDKRKPLFGNQNVEQYYLKDVEFPTWISNAYSDIKQATSSGRNKMSYKEFAKYLRGEKIYLEDRVDYSPFLRTLYDFDPEKHKDACKRLFNLLKKNYLKDDGNYFVTSEIILN